MRRRSPSTRPGRVRRALLALAILIGACGGKKLTRTIDVDTPVRMDAPSKQPIHDPGAIPRPFPPANTFRVDADADVTEPDGAAAEAGTDAGPDGRPADVGSDANHDGRTIDGGTDMAKDGSLADGGTDTARAVGAVDVGIDVPSDAGSR